MNFRVIIVGLLLLVVGLSHWLTPTETYILYGLHVAMRKMFILPVVLAAIWFNRRGAFVAALIATAVYVPHVYLQWSGEAAEQLNQASDVVVIWAIAILTSWLVENEKTALQMIVQSNSETLFALVAALDTREHETGQHSLRVRAYALHIGKQLALPQQDMRVLEQAALLHDVGKIGIPDHILRKPGALNDQEMNAMRKHPEIGYRILEPIRFLKNTAAAVYAHHEKFDGTGYPRGLRGESTPLAARIFAVADAFDALTSDRPYRGAVSIDEACDIIKRDRERHFDPAVVDAFLKIPEEDWVQIRQAVKDKSAMVELQTGTVSLE